MNLEIAGAGSLKILYNMTGYGGVIANDNVLTKRERAEISEILQPYVDAGIFRDLTYTTDLRAMTANGMSFFCIQRNPKSEKKNSYAIGIPFHSPYEETLSFLQVRNILRSYLGQFALPQPRFPAV